MGAAVERPTPRDIAETRDQIAQWVAQLHTTVAVLQGEIRLVRREVERRRGDPAGEPDDGSEPVDG